MYRVAIVEDEDFYVNQIQDFIKQFSEEENEEFDVFVFRDGDTIASNYKAQFDIIFMDIQMRFIDGMTAAQEIRKLDSEVVIIFITNRTDYAIKGYEVDALDYVLKPVTYFTFAQKLKKAVLKVSTKGSHYVLINAAGITKKVNVDDILYLESHGHREHVDTGNPALDALLESKALRAKKSNIELTLVVDGKLLEHIYVVDLCTLFGNALDNAIEAEAISEREEQRMIHLTVSELKGFVIIKVENYMHKPIKLGDSLPHTTKSDSQNHGYGLKSIRYVAEKYNGHMDISMMDNWFVLTVMLPRRK